jgi:hypothetical protein
MPAIKTTKYNSPAITIEFISNGYKALHVKKHY